MMSERARQKWIGLTMDLMIAYYDACDEPHGPSQFLRPICDRVADAIGDGATGEAVWESLQRRLRSMPGTISYSLDDGTSWVSMAYATYSLESEYGPNWRKIIGLGDDV